jgi:hypothetical protein
MKLTRYPLCRSRRPCGLTERVQLLRQAALSRCRRCMMQGRAGKGTGPVRPNKKTARPTYIDRLQHREPKLHHLILSLRVDGIGDKLEKRKDVEWNRAILSLPSCAPDYTYLLLVQVCLGFLGGLSIWFQRELQRLQ